MCRVNQVSEDRQNDTDCLFSALRTTSKVSEMISQQMTMMTEHMCALECRLEKVEEGSVENVDAHDTLPASVSDSSDSTVQSSLIHQSSQSTFKGLAILTTILCLLSNMVLQCVLGALTKFRVDVVQRFIAWGENNFGAVDRGGVVGDGSWWDGKWIWRRKKRKNKRKRNFKTFR